MFRDKKQLKDYFVKPPDPKELVRKWQADLRKEQRSLERTIRDIQRSEREAKKMVTDNAKRGDMASAKACDHENTLNRHAVVWH